MAELAPAAPRDEGEQRSEAERELSRVGAAAGTAGRAALVEGADFVLVLGVAGIEGGDVPHEAIVLLDGVGDQG